MLVECACVCDLLLLVLNSRSKHKKQKQTDRETDNRSNTIERFDYVFNGGVDGYKLTDLWLFADWNSKVSICTYCHQTLNRGNRFVYIRSFSPSEAALGDCWLCHQAHWTLQYLCRWIKFEQLFSSTWWIHFHLILVVSFLLYFPYGYIEWLAPVYVYMNQPLDVESMVYVQRFNRSMSMANVAAMQPSRWISQPRPNRMQKDNRSENVNNWCGSKKVKCKYTLE